MICARATQRVQQLREHGYADAQLYDPTETSVRGTHAFFLILGEPEAYGLPPKPQTPTIHLKAAWTAAFATAIGAIVLTLRHKQGVKRQDVSAQVAREPAMAIEIRKVSPGQGT